MSALITAYDRHVATRKKSKLPPQPLDGNTTKAVIEEINQGNDVARMLSILLTQVSPGRSPGPDAKADFLRKVINRELNLEPNLTVEAAFTAMGQIRCGKAVDHLIELLEVPEFATRARQELTQMVLIYKGDLEKVNKLRLEQDNKEASLLMQAWANGDWFNAKPEVPKEIKIVMLELPKAPTTDGFSPAGASSTRDDLPLHAQSMCDEHVRSEIERLQKLHGPDVQVVLFADEGVMGAGSSRLSATNSLSIWTGKEIPGTPGKKHAPIIMSGKDGFAPIFSRAVKGDGGLAIQTDTTSFKTGDVLILCPEEGKIKKDGNVVAEFKPTPVDLQKYRAGSSAFLNTGKQLMKKAAALLERTPPQIFAEPKTSGRTNGQTLAEKIASRGAGRKVYAGDEDVIVDVNIVGSQDTTGPMTLLEMQALGIDKIAPNLVMLQSQCHKAGEVNEKVIAANTKLVDYMKSRGAVTLKLGDGVIHSWLNKLNFSPYNITVGGDSHTRNALGLAFGADSAAVAYAAAHGKFVIDEMPGTVKVNIKGELPPGVTYRDVINNVALQGCKQNGGVNPFQDRFVEFHGLNGLDSEVAFAFTDATAETSAVAGCVVFDRDNIIKSIEENLRYVREMIEKGYDTDNSLAALAELMVNYLKAPEVPEPDKDAEYVKEINIDLSTLAEPQLSDPRPNPDDVSLVKTLTEYQQTEPTPIVVDEVFVGSCMTSAEDFVILAQILRDYRAQHPDGKLNSKLWIAPPRVDIMEALKQTGDWEIFTQFGLEEVPVTLEDKQKALQTAEKHLKGNTKIFSEELKVGKDNVPTKADGLKSLVGDNADMKEELAKFETLASKHFKNYRDDTKKKDPSGVLNKFLQYVSHAALSCAEPDEIYAAAVEVTGPAEKNFQDQQAALENIVKLNNKLDTPVAGLNEKCEQLIQVILDSRQAMRDVERVTLPKEFGISTEEPGCSLCMGNQKRSRPGAQMVSTSTRPYLNRMGDGAQVFLGSPAVAGVAAILGHMPTLEEYRSYTKGITIKHGRPDTDVLGVTRSDVVSITKPELTAAAAKTGTGV